MKLGSFVALPSMLEEEFIAEVVDVDDETWEENMSVCPLSLLCR